MHGIHQIETSFLVYMEMGINYLQFLNGSQMEAWALYSAVCVVSSDAGTVKFSEQQTVDLNEDLINGRPFLTLHADDQQERFL